MSGYEQRPGDWRAVCARSGFVGWASEMVKDPVSGLRVLARFADVRNPQEFVRPRTDHEAVPWASPEGADVEVSPVLTKPSDL